MKHRILFFFSIFLVTMVFLIPRSKATNVETAVVNGIMCPNARLVQHGLMLTTGFGSVFMDDGVVDTRASTNIPVVGFMKDSGIIFFSGNSPWRIMNRLIMPSRGNLCKTVLKESLVANRRHSPGYMVLQLFFTLPVTDRC